MAKSKRASTKKETASAEEEKKVPIIFRVPRFDRRRARIAAMQEGLTLQDFMAQILYEKIGNPPRKRRMTKEPDE